MPIADSRSRCSSSRLSAMRRRFCSSSVSRRSVHALQHEVQPECRHRPSRRTGQAAGLISIRDQDRRTESARGERSGACPPSHCAGLRDRSAAAVCDRGRAARRAVDPRRCSRTARPRPAPTVQRSARVAPASSDATAQRAARPTHTSQIPVRTSPATRAHRRRRGRVVRPARAAPARAPASRAGNAERTVRMNSKASEIERDDRQADDVEEAEPCRDRRNADDQAAAAPARSVDRAAARCRDT